MYCQWPASYKQAWFICFLWRSSSQQNNCIIANIWLIREAYCEENLPMILEIPDHCIFNSTILYSQWVLRSAKLPVWPTAWKLATKMPASNKPLLLLCVIQLGFRGWRLKSMLNFYGKKVHQEGNYILGYPPRLTPVLRFLLPELAPKKLLENNTFLVHSVVNDA